MHAKNEYQYSLFGHEPITLIDHHRKSRLDTVS